MADRKIGYAVQSGNIVRVYDDKKCQIMTKNGQLMGYTCDTATIKDGHTIRVWNAKGAQIATHNA